jgi:hypothetical protein
MQFMLVTLSQNPSHRPQQQTLHWQRVAVVLHASIVCNKQTRDIPTLPFALHIAKQGNQARRDPELA